LVGQFGEGMKLSVLTLLRYAKTRKVLIKTEEDVWEFSLEKDPLFDNVECLHVMFGKREKKFKLDDPACVEVMVTELSEEEWIDFRQKIYSLNTDIKIDIRLKKMLATL